MTIAVIGLAVGVRKILSEKPWRSFGGSLVHCGMLEILRSGDVEIVASVLGAERVAEWLFWRVSAEFDRT